MLGEPCAESPESGEAGEEAGRGTVASLSPQTISSWAPRAPLMVRDKTVLSTPLPFCQGVWVESRLRWELLSASGVQPGQGLLGSPGPLFFSCCCWGRGLGAPGPQGHHLAAMARLAVLLGTELFFRRAPLDLEHSQGIQEVLSKCLWSGEPASKEVGSGQTQESQEGVLGRWRP